MAQAPDLVPQTKLADGAKLVGHGLPLLAAQRDIGFRRVKTPYIAGERHDMKTVHLAVAITSLTFSVDTVYSLPRALTPGNAGNKSIRGKEPK
jgi:hypothetical protein